jgi:hypothetical protein
MSSSKELERWNKMDAIQPNEGPFIDESRRLSALFEKFREVLTEGEHAGKKQLVIPEVRMDNYSRETKKSISSSGYFFKPKDRRDGTDIYCFIQPDLTKLDDIYRLRLSADGVVANIDEGSDNFESKDLLISLLFNAESQLDRRMRSYQLEKRGKRTKLALTIGLSGIFASAGIGIKALLDHKEANEAKQEAARKAFDASEYRLRSGNFVISSGEVAKIATDEFNKIPSYRNGDSLQSPRRITIEEESCKKLKVQTISGREARIAVKLGDQWLSKPLGIIAVSPNELQVCAPGELENDSNTNEREIAIELAPQ